MNTKVCYKCPDRKVGCHGYCEKYKELKEYYEEVRKQRSHATDFHIYSVRTIMKNKFLGERWF